MKEEILKIVEKYLIIYPDETFKIKKLLKFLNNFNDEDIIDWNNFVGHVTVGGFIFAKEENMFLVLYHNDLKMYLYPGGHIDKSDNSILDALYREIYEETGLINLNILKIFDDELVPLDIDIHRIGFNDRLNLPEHFHFDFRYLFVIDRISEIFIDESEFDNYKWVNIYDLASDINYGKIISKFNKIMTN